jgi:uncharacterized protein YlxW (UPF0749 family)
MDKLFSFKTLISVTALVIAGCAALFSVTGIGTLFAGAAVSAMVMASALELGKLVGISFLYRYWDTIPRMLKVYLSVASVVLIVITSAGIYGYLSSAYARVAAVPLQLNAEVQILNSQVTTADEEIKRKTQRLDQIIQLRGQQENRIDDLIIKSTTGNTSTIRNAQNQLTELNKTATTLQQEINIASARRDSLKAKSLTTDVAITTNSDIGTFVYISRALGVELDAVVKWFILVIVLVFDPLSICLVLAYNFLVKKESPKKDAEESPKHFAVYSDPPQRMTPIESDAKVVATEPQSPIPGHTPELDPEDPYPQYMTKSETEEMMERWWAKRNGLRR